MAQPAQTKRMTQEEFDSWIQMQNDRYELVDGVPLLKFAEWDGPRMMVGASNGHNRIVRNVVVALEHQLRGKACQPYAADGKIRISPASYRFPDIAIDCGPFDRKASHLARPVTVVEVLSKSTFWLDHNRKLSDYQSVPTIMSILLLSQDEMRGQLWRRRASAWKMEELRGPEAVAELLEAEARLLLAEAYDGVVA